VIVQLTGDAVGDAVRLLLGGFAGLRDLMLDSVVLAGPRVLGLALDAALLPLHGVRELVRQQSISLLRAGGKLTRPKMDVLPNRKRLGAE
jgi:hypothetical protein